MRFLFISEWAEDLNCREQKKRIVICEVNLPVDRKRTRPKGFFLRGNTQRETEWWIDVIKTKRRPDINWLQRRRSRTLVYFNPNLRKMNMRWSRGLEQQQRAELEYCVPIGRLFFTVASSDRRTGGGETLMTEQPDPEWKQSRVFFMLILLPSESHQHRHRPGNCSSCLCSSVDFSQHELKWFMWWHTCCRNLMLETSNVL